MLIKKPMDYLRKMVTLDLYIKYVIAELALRVRNLK